MPRALPWVVTVVTFACADAAVEVPDAGSPVYDTGLHPGWSIDAGGRADAGIDDGASPSDDAGATNSTGNRAWCGPTRLDGTEVVRAGEVVTVCAGSELELGPGAKLEVRGELRLEGAADRRVKLTGAAEWKGIEVVGRLSGEHVEIAGAEVCVRVAKGGVLELASATLVACGQSLVVDGSASLHASRILGGASVELRGGSLTLTRTVLDLLHPEQSPDCLVVSGGALRVDHSHLSGCHCPLHVNAATSPLEITRSILDQAVYPVMITDATGTFRENHLIGGKSHFLDIGGRIAIDIADNYFGGGPPDIDSSDLDQFEGRASYRGDPVPGVGP